MIDGFVPDFVDVRGNENRALALGARNEGNSVARLVGGYVLQPALREAVAEKAHESLFAEGGRGDFAAHDRVGEEDLTQAGECRAMGREVLEDGFEHGVHKHFSGQSGARRSIWQEGADARDRLWRRAGRIVSPPPEKGSGRTL